jgi:leucyl aminopeptidase (aminopeptidase T)
MDMSCDTTRELAETEMGMIGHPSDVHITTELGTDLTFSMKQRRYTFFNGNFWPRHRFSSASFEICIPIVETETNGTLVCDGSFGYIGKVREPVHITWKDGRITGIEDNPEGRRLRAYFESYEDPEMYVGGELGIGLNALSRCAGECYIEDESTLGTFHIGVGRNIGLGGIHKASGHFDLVTWNPTISFDGRTIMEHGKFLIPNDVNLSVTI